MKSLYLANSLGFSEIGRSGLDSLKSILNSHFVVHDPFQPTESSDRLINLENKFRSEALAGTYTEWKEKYHVINNQIALQNENAIKSCDVVFAVLSEVDVDSGVAAEIGYGYGIGKPIYGYRNDFRQSGENLGAIINLQVQYFIEASGGYIFGSLQDIQDWMK